MECIALRDGVLTATYNGFSNLKIEEDSKEPGSVLIFSKTFSLKNKGFRVLKKRKKVFPDFSKTFSLENKGLRVLKK